MSVLVWAYAELDELNNQVGFVEIEDESLAKELLEKEYVQDPSIGVLHFAEIGTPIPAAKIVPSKKATK